MACSNGCRHTALVRCDPLHILPRQALQVGQPQVGSRGRGRLWRRLQDGSDAHGGRRYQLERPVLVPEIPLLWDAILDEARLPASCLWVPIPSDVNGSLLLEKKHSLSESLVVDLGRIGE